MKVSLATRLLLATALFAEPSLQKQLEDRSAESARKGDPEVRAACARGIDAVAASGITDKAFKVGDKAPDFTLTDASGKPITLSTLLEDGPVVLT